MNIRRAINEKYQNAKIKAHDAIEWCKDNPKEALALGYLGFISYRTISKNRLANKRIKLENEKLLYVWDFKRGFRWRLKRPLTKEESIYLKNRVDSGESVGDVLYKMDLLK